MPVILRTSSEVPEPSAYDTWFAITGTKAAGVENKRLAGLARRLESSFNAIIPKWWKLAKDMADGPGAELAYATTCATYGSDFGLMMAWTDLVDRVAENRDRCLVLCDDPWMFRHLAARRRVAAATPPSLLVPQSRLFLRGWLARARLVLRLAWSRLVLGSHKRRHKTGDAVLLVYAHPDSTAKGFEVYFGNLMSEIPELRRLLHTDCPVGRARELAADGRTASLHAWGGLTALPGILRTRWRPERRHLTGSWGWLVQRAQALEGGGAAHAMNAWQRLCHRRWLLDVRPRAVSWPWENHGWERDFCRAARQFDIPTVGYQHTVIGPHQLNYSPITNKDGIGSLPDRVVCSGPAYLDQLKDWGFPEDRLGIGGSLRVQRITTEIHDPHGPVFVALSARRTIARQQMAAVRAAAEKGLRWIVKDHPMYPVDFAETENVTRTRHTVPEQTAISAVVYSTGTSGLEALLAGVPTYRLLPEDEIAIDILPPFVTVPTITAETLAETLAGKPILTRLDPDRVTSSVDMDLWRRLLLDPDRPHASPRSADESLTAA